MPCCLTLVHSFTSWALILPASLSLPQPLLSSCCLPCLAPSRFVNPSSFRLHSRSLWLALTSSGSPRSLPCLPHLSQPSTFLPPSCFLSPSSFHPRSHSLYLAHTLSLPCLLLFLSFPTPPSPPLPPSFLILPNSSLASLVSHPSRILPRLPRFSFFPTPSRSLCPSLLFAI